MKGSVTCCILLALVCIFIQNVAADKGTVVDHIGNVGFAIKADKDGQIVVLGMTRQNASKFKIGDRVLFVRVPNKPGFRDEAQSVVKLLD